MSWSFFAIFLTVYIALCVAVALYAKVVRGCSVCQAGGVFLMSLYVTPLLGLMGCEPFLYEKPLRWRRALRRKRLNRELRSHNVRVRVEAADCLAELGDQSSVVPLIESLSDEFYHVRLAAAEALVAIGDERAVAPMLATLSGRGLDVDHAVLRLVLITGARQAIPRLLGLLKETNSRIEEDECRRVHKGSDAALGFTYGALLEHRTSWREHIVRALGALKASEAVPALLPLLEERCSVPDWVHVHVDRRPLLDAERDIRTATARALAQIGDQRAVPALIRLLDADGHDFCQPHFSVINALAELGDPSAIRPLIRYWETSDYPTVYGPKVSEALKALTYGRPLEDESLRAKVEALTREMNQEIADGMKAFEEGRPTTTATAATSSIYGTRLCRRMGSSADGVVP